MELSGSVADYIDKQVKWKDALTLIRGLILETGLVETVKWGAPVYALDGKNVLGLSAFKGYVGIWFFQGVFLKDKNKKLVNAQEGSTKAMRQMRFTNIEDIDILVVKSYLNEAIANQRAGKMVKVQRTTSFEMPDELNKALKADTSLNSKYQELTYGKQKEFALYILEAKQETTRLKRLEKVKPMINAGVGLHDKYR